MLPCLTDLNKLPCLLKNPFFRDLVVFLCQNEGTGKKRQSRISVWSEERASEMFRGMNKAKSATIIGLKTDENGCSCFSKKRPWLSPMRPGK